jgi:hypothetical protein
VLSSGTKTIRIPHPAWTIIRRPNSVEIVARNCSALLAVRRLDAGVPPNLGTPRMTATSKAC